MSAWLLSLIAAWLPATQPPRTHELKLAPETVHWGYYDARVKPVVRIAPGDTVVVETMVARGIDRLKQAGVADAEIPDSLKAVERAIADRGPGAHPMTGPIFVEGAAPGDVIEVRIQRIEFLHNYGVTAFLPGGGTIPTDFPYGYLKLLRFDPAKGVASFGSGITLPLRPFFGSIGVAPPLLAGRISSNPPGPHTGNLDNKDLVVGSTLYLPVHVPGALLSIGDAHAMQGDGEVSGTAVETSARGTFQVLLHKSRAWHWPRAETPTHFMTMGLHEDLDEAARMAVREMIDYLVKEKRLTRDDAYVLCSIAVDLRVTQTVDGTKGIHAMIAKSIFAN